MAGILTEVPQKPPSWFIKLCKFFWRTCRFFWAIIILGIVLNVFATWLFLASGTNLTGTPIGWILQNRVMLALAGIILILLYVIAYLGSHLSGNISEEEVKHLYLNHMILLKKILTLTGIPAGLIAEGVPLDEIFIPLEFRPNRPLSDYPLTEEELRRYRELQRRGILSEEMDRILLEAEKQNWQHIIEKSDRISIAVLWERLTRERPVAIIQGFPGIGKSTFLNRLALNMARRSSGYPDQTMPAYLEPSLIPIFLSLTDYANECAKIHDLSLSAYLNIALGRLNIPHIAQFIQKSLGAGRCLILLDGLDEVSSLEIRTQIQEAVKIFILDQRNIYQKGGIFGRFQMFAKNLIIRRHLASKETDYFNRFLITSRVAGYDQNAFSDYANSHYTIAELSPQQIEDFLPRWCRANVRGRRNNVEQEMAISLEAQQMEKDLRAAIKDHQGVRELTENPLLLTLLAVMQQNSIQLPQRRVELFSIVARTLLENRNIVRGLPSIPETQAIQYLGPIAFQMQETQNSFSRHKDVKEALKQTVSLEGGTAEQVEQEVENFLLRIRERGGLFVIRTGDYFGFFHRTFQEYFVARYIVNEIKRNPIRWLPKLVQMARRADDLWREPFLLAVAYQSGEDEIIAQHIVDELLNIPDDSSLESIAHDLLLATECVIEAKPLTIGRTLESKVAVQLLRAYLRAQVSQQFDICNRIEEAICHWLLILSEEAYRPALLIILEETITDAHHPPLQRAALTLLIIIAQQLVECSPKVFDTLIPPLLALTDLPAVDKNQLRTHPLSPDLTISDLSLTTLSFMGKRGPAGLFLATVRQHFKDYPEHLRLLARYSLESRTLLTPAVVPLTEENYKHFESTIVRWLFLRDQYKPDRIAESEVDMCFDIHQSLLLYAEEVCYPGAIHLLNMLQVAANHPAELWQHAWQVYLLEQMASDNYTTFQSVSALWAMLFPDDESLKKLATVILTHYSNDGSKAQRYAQRFLATLSNDLLDLPYLRYLRDSRISRNVNDMRDIRDKNYLRKLRSPRDVRYLRNLRNMRNLKILGDILRVENEQNIDFLLYLEYLRSPRYLRYLLFTPDLVSKALKGLPNNDVGEYVDILTIFLGRILQIQEAHETSNLVEDELLQIIRVACSSLVSSTNEEICEAALDIIRYLPARSLNEIKFVLQLAEEVDTRIQRACVDALERARPNVQEAWALLESSKNLLTRADIVRAAIERRLERR